MTNEETKQALFEAFSAGNYRVNNVQPEGSVQERFDEWYVKYRVNLIKESVTSGKVGQAQHHFDIMCRCDDSIRVGDKSKGCCCYD